MNINDLCRYSQNKFFGYLLLISWCFCYLCYFLVIYFLLLSNGFVTFAQAVTINQEGSHGTNKEV